MVNYMILLFKGICLLQIVQSLAAPGHVNIQVQVLQYDNPLGTSFHGSDFTSERKCCDKGQVTACSTTDMCDSYFVLCIGGITTSGLSRHCSGPKSTTKIFRNANSFGASHDNILVQSFKWDNWHAGDIEYLINVMDQDSGNDELIENFTSIRALTVGSSYENSTEHVISFINFVSLDLGVRIWCQDGYFGSDCSNKCTSNPYSVCINNQATLLPSCNDADVSSFEFTGIMNYKVTNLQLLLIKFVLQEICPKAQNAHVKIVHFSVSGVVEFKATCDNVAVSSLTFSTHLYILRLTNKAALSHYFPGILLKTPSVTQKNIRGAHTLMILRALSYHDSSSACKTQSCNIRLTVCVHPQQHGCIIMSSTLSTTNLALCNGHLIDRSSAGQGQSATYFIGLNSWPGINVEVKYNGRTKWHEDNQTLQSYTAGVGYNETTNYRMTIQSNDQHQALVLDMMLWCAHGWSGDQCKHRCHSTSNKMCNKDGKLACKHDINECSGQSSCKNGGTCKNTIGSFICQCRTGWTGPTCEVDIDECNLGYCTNASTCTNSPGSFHCRCNRGFHGRQCTDLNECKIPVKLCQHESTCLNHYGSFACRCGEGYSGARCDKDVDECSLSICSPHSTNCSNTFGSYRCNCSAGWTGKNCENDIDECKSNPCYHGTCINTDGSYKCRCYPGYDGTYCEHDADECLKITCPNNGTCVNLNPPQRFRCDCLKGWDPKSRCHHHIDECKLSNPCVHGACISNTGDYICTCDTGWTGRNCSVDLNECRHQPCLHNGTCINRLGSYKCHCSVGWVGKNCSIDINECDVIQPCGLYGKCNNVDGGYTCQCAAGWMGQNCYVDINECNTLQPCKNNGKCSNTEGGYACHCAVGWTGQNCSVDVNECSKFHPCQNNGSCSNTQGLYLCHCADGWKGQTCSTDINECNTLHPCSHNAKCKNTMGGYTCSCSVGWQGNNCTVDVNECDTFHPCQNKGSCVNTVGSYICQCPVEWKGQNCSVDVNECETFHPCHNKGSCINTEGNYTCQCPAEWKGQNCTVDVNECNISPCKHNATCYNFEDGYNCTCPPFWTGKNCEIEVEECNNFPCNKHSTTTSAQTSSIFVRLEDAIYPGCTSSGWNVTLDMPTLTQLYPEIKADQIYFGDNSCRGKLMGTQLIFLQGFKDCLTAERISGDTIIYENELFYAIYDSIHPFIIRQHKWTYGVECDISRNEATSSHVHHNVETHHSAISGHYSINMTFFKDPEYMNQLPGNPIQTSVGDDVYVKVFTTATDWNIKMRLHTCYTKPKETTTNMTYNIIRDGCEVDSNTHIISQSTHETRFVFQDFEYSTNREGLNIYCNATFCETKDFSPGCAQSCIPHETQALVGK